MKHAQLNQCRTRATHTSRAITSACSAIEGLERRSLFAGGVVASVIDGTLVVRGDVAANVIALNQTGLASNQVRITSTDTRINRHSRAIVFSDITEGVTIRMGGGADSISATGVYVVGDLAITTTGPAGVTLTGVSISKSLRLGLDSSAGTITNARVGQDLKVAGAEDVTLTGVRVDRNAELMGGVHADTVTIEDSTFRGFTRLESGRGADVTQIDSNGSASGALTRFDGPVRFLMGDGADTLQLGVVGQSGNHTVFGGRTYFDGDGGSDTLSNVGAGTYLKKSQSVTKSFEINIPVADTIPPTVATLTPTDTKTNVAINRTLAVTFDEPMDEDTFANNFTVTGPSSSNFVGVADYDPLTGIATFTHTNYFANNTLYTAKITGGINGVKDLAGNPLAADRVWTFTTGTQIAQDPIDLGDAAAFAVMATASISSTGATQVNGDVGLNPGSSQGIPTGQVSGSIHVNDSAVIAARADLLSAYNDAVSRTITSKPLVGNMGGLTYTPGLYTNLSSVQIQGSGPGNNVTLDAEGDPNAIFIFKISTTLTTGPGAQVILAGGAKASNVFWQVGTSASLDTTTIFKGSILASVTITANAGTVIEGRLLAGSNTDGSVTLNATTITVPMP